MPLRCNLVSRLLIPLTLKALSSCIMLIGEVFLETMATGIITQEEIDWLTTHQSSFDREEEAKALKIGRLLDEGQIQIGCRLLGTHRPVPQPNNA
ncbi:MAG: hypothetical protein ACK55H_10570 [Cyanobacteriota bacterium]